MTDSTHTQRPLLDANAGNPLVGESSLGPIPESVVEEAIGWYVQFASGMGTPEAHDCTQASAHAAFTRWYEAHPDHARAWARIEGMKQRLHGGSARKDIPANHVTPTLLTFFGRRKTLKRLAWAGVTVVSLDLVQKRLPWRQQLAVVASDVRTPVGGRRSMTLADGTHLLLNTDTAVDLHFDTHERRIILRQGEILVTTHKDGANRPFIVTTNDGDLVPVGTQFSVRYRDQPDQESVTRLLIVEGAVKVRAQRQPSTMALLVHAGKQVCFTRDAVEPVKPADGALLAWTDGMFAAERMRLDAFLAELSRYRAGWLRCSPDVAALRITGVWPLNGVGATDSILDSMARRLPVQIRRITPYWVQVSAA